MNGNSDEMVSYQLLPASIGSISLALVYSALIGLKTVMLTWDWLQRDFFLLSNFCGKQTVLLMDGKSA
jgi:hypothetical protein